MSEIILINACERLAEITGHKVLGDQARELLFSQGLTFYSIGKGKGGRVMVTAEVSDTLPRFDWQVSPKRKEKATPTTKTVTVEKVVERIDPAWKAEIEGIVLEQESRLDSLHKAVAEVTSVYAKLRAEVDPSAKLPLPPTLPPKYLYKVVVVGLDAPSVQRLQDNFRNTKIVHVGEGRNSDLHRGIGLPKSPDMILCMTSYCNHQLRNTVEAKYGKDRLHYVKGSQSSAEAAIAVWLHAKEAEVAKA